MTEKVLSNLQSIIHNGGWIAQYAILATGIGCLQDLTDATKSLIPVTPQLFLSANSVDKAEANILNYPVGLFNFIAGTASPFDYMPTLRKRYVLMLLQNL